MDETQIIVEETPADRLKKFVEKHKVAITATVTAAICLTIHRISLKQHDAFLEERGLLEEFYLPEEDLMYY